MFVNDLYMGLLFTDLYVDVFFLLQLLFQIMNPCIYSCRKPNLSYLSWLGLFPPPHLIVDKIFVATVHFLNDMIVQGIERSLDDEVKQVWNKKQCNSKQCNHPIHRCSPNDNMVPHIRRCWIKVKWVRIWAIWEFTVQDVQSLQLHPPLWMQWRRVHVYSQGRWLEKPPHHSLSIQ